MNALVQLSDALVIDRKYNFKSFKLNAGCDYFPGMGIDYLMTENIPILLLPERVSIRLKIVLLTFAVYMYANDEKGAYYDRTLLTDTLVHCRDYVNVLYNLDAIYRDSNRFWDINEDLANVVSLIDMGKEEEVS